MTCFLDLLPLGGTMSSSCHNERDSPLDGQPQSSHRPIRRGKIDQTVETRIQAQLRADGQTEHSESGCFTRVTTKLWMPRRFECSSHHKLVVFPSERQNALAHAPTYTID